MPLGLAPLLALSGGAGIFLAFALLMVVALAFSMYTKKGSGIEQRPHDGSDGAPGAEGQSRIKRKDGDNADV